MKRLAFAALAAFAMSGTAFAADLAPQPVEPIAPAYLPYSWTGFYVGLNAGAAFDMSKFDNTNDPNRGLQPIPNLDFDDVGFLGGVHAGYNYQMGSFVLGVEGSADFGSLDDKAKTPDGAGFIELKQDWLASAGIRLGYAYDRLLIYASGGAAFTSYGVNTNDTFGALFTASYSDKTKVGWTVGAGVEYAIYQNWTVGLDYKYYDFGSKNYASTAPAGPGFDFFKIKAAESVVTARLSYKF